MIYDDLSSSGKIIYVRVEAGACDLTKLTAAKTKGVITAAEFTFIKGAFNL